MNRDREVLYFQDLNEQLQRMLASKSKVIDGLRVLNAGLNNNFEALNHLFNNLALKLGDIEYELNNASEPVSETIKEIFNRY